MAWMWATKAGLAALSLGVVIVAACSAPGDAGPAASDASVDAGACVAAGGRCVVGASCGIVGPADSCGPGGATCCLDVVCAADATAYPIQASSYDQSCTVASDCVMVATGNACVVCFNCSPNAWINHASLTQYNADIANSPARQACECPSEFVQPACCNAGLCGSCEPATDAGADTEAGSLATCSGPSDCSGDEVCLYAPGSGCSAAGHCGPRESCVAQPTPIAVCSCASGQSLNLSCAPDAGIAEQTTSGACPVAPATDAGAD